tara:strand:+ start:761 stop:1612 length:852 start_codon:yes stop_codon:yes gene_type:complete
MEPEKNSKKNPYNFNNKLLTRDFIVNLFYEYNIGIMPIDISVYQNAFIHKSYSLTKNNLEDIVDKPDGALELMNIDNERLEFLGDSILSFVVAKYLYERYPKQNEGFLTKLRTKLVNGDALCYFSQELGFGEYIIMSRYIEDKCNGRKSTNILEDVFESFIGSMFLDFNKKEIPNTDLYSGFGFHICEKFLINLIEEKVDFEDLITTDTNYKEQIFRYFQTTYHKYPSFRHISCVNEGNKKTFTVEICSHDGKTISQGGGNTKKKAEQNASKNALIHLKIINI